MAQLREREIVVIGAGPGGLQCSYELKRLGLDHVVLEKDSAAGSSFVKFPIHRKLISINKLYNFFDEPDFNFRHDWNSLDTEEFRPLMRDYSVNLFPDADDLVRYLRDFAEMYELPVEYECGVNRVRRAEADGDGFVIETTRGEYRCRVLICAVGATGPTVPQDIPGIELADQYVDHVPVASRYRNKRVLVVGGGNSGFETADALSAEAAIVHVALRRRITHAWDSHFVGDLRAINNNLLDMYQLKSLHAVIGDPPVAISRCADGSGALEVTFREYVGHPDVALGELELKRVYDAVICCTGFNWVPDFFAEDCRPETHTRGKYVCLTSAWESTNVKGLYFAGAVTQSRDRKAASGFIHGFRYSARTLVHLLAHFRHERPLARVAVTPSLDGLTRAVCGRLTTVSSLFQMFGVLCDVLVLDGARTRAELFTRLPRAWVVGEPEGAAGPSPFLTGADDAFVITLQFGFGAYPAGVSALDFLQDSGTVNAACGAFLHPVLEHFRAGRQLATYHLFETLDIRFTQTTHTKGDSYSTLNMELLADIFRESLGLPHLGSTPLRPLYRLSSAATPVEEKRALFAQHFPVDRVWTPEELAAWRRYVRESLRPPGKTTRGADPTCNYVPVPLSVADLHAASIPRSDPGETS